MPNKEPELTSVIQHPWTVLSLVNDGGIMFNKLTFHISEGFLTLLLLSFMITSFRKTAQLINKFDW